MQGHRQVGARDDADVRLAAGRNDAPVQAAVESLLMPGPVTQAHAKLEVRVQQLPRSQPIAARRASCASTATRRSPPTCATSGAPRSHDQCRAPASAVGCHTEHRGRDSDIVQLEPGRSSIIARPISRSRARIARWPARAATRPGEAYRKAPPTCVSCHKDDDYPRGPAGQGLRRLPQPATAGQGRSFDHGKTDFALTGAHQADHLRRLPPRRPLQGIAEDLRRLPRHRRCAPRLSAATTAASATRPATGRRRSSIMQRRPASRCWARTPSSTARPATAAATTRTRCRRTATAAIEPTIPTPARFGDKCNDCHGNEPGSRSTTITRRDAKFALEGAHAKLGCHVCHTARVGDAEARHRLRRLPPRARIRTAVRSRATATAVTASRTGAREHQSSTTTSRISRCSACMPWSAARSATARWPSAGAKRRCNDCHAHGGRA